MEIIAAAVPRFPFQRICHLCLSHPAFRLFEPCQVRYLLSVRLLCELFAIGLLLWLGWSKSFQDWTNQMRGIAPEKPAAIAASANRAAPPPNVPLQPFNQPPVRRAVAAPQPTRGGDWMWDPTHRGTLDRPAYDPKNPSQTYQDAAHRRYWLDAQGNRHYENDSPAPH